MKLLLSKYASAILIDMQKQLKYCELKCIVHTSSKDMGRAWVGHGSDMGRAWVGHGSEIPDAILASARHGGDFFSGSAGRRLQLSALYVLKKVVRDFISSPLRCRKSIVFFFTSLVFLRPGHFCRLSFIFSTGTFVTTLRGEDVLSLHRDQ